MTKTDADETTKNGAIHRFGGDQDELVYSLIQEIAAVKGVEPIELSPLSSTVDVDALTALIDHSHSESTSVTFEYCDCEVTVDGTGEVEVDENR